MNRNPRGHISFNFHLLRARCSLGLRSQPQVHAGSNLLLHLTHTASHLLFPGHSAATNLCVHFVRLAMIPLHTQHNTTNYTSKEVWEIAESRTHRTNFALTTQQVRVSHHKQAVSTFPRKQRPSRYASWYDIVFACPADRIETCLKRKSWPLQLSVEICWKWLWYWIIKTLFNA